MNEENIKERLVSFVAYDTPRTSIIDLCEELNLTLAEVIIMLKRKDDIGYLTRLAYNKVMKPYLQPNVIHKNTGFIDWSFKAMGLPTMSDSQR